MGDISNAVLIALVLVAIVVSVGGTMVTLSMLRPTVLQMTGVLTTTGTLKFEIESLVGVNMTQVTVDLKNGSVVSDYTSCTISTNDTADNSTYCNWTSYGAYACPNTENCTFKIENVGNVLANVTIASNETAADYVCGGAGVCQDATPEVYFYAEANESAACGDIASGWDQLNTTATKFCNNWEYNNSKDELTCHVQITIPRDAPPTGASKPATITFAANAA